MATSVDRLLDRVHHRVGAGVEITTTAGGSCEVRWRRDYAGVASDERCVTRPALTEALTAVLSWEDEADEIDARDPSWAVS